MADEKKVTMTTAGAYRATERGYAGRELIEPGRLVPPGVPVGSWMERVKGGEERLARAMEQATDPQPDDVEMENLSKSALEAIAAEKGIDPKGLSKQNLVDAIKAAHDKDRAQ